MKATETIPVSSPEIESIIEDLIESGGEWDDEMLDNLALATSTAEGALEAVDRITDLMNFVFTSKIWVKARQLSSKERENIAGQIKSMLPVMFEMQGDKEPSLTSPVKRKDGVKLVYVKPSTKPGTVDTTDPALENATTIRGFTETEARSSEIPFSLFEPKTVYVPNLEMIGEYLDRGEPVGLCKRIEPKGHVRITHPLSLQAAADKIKRAEAKKKNEFKGGGE